MGTNFFLHTKNKKMAEKYAPYSYKLTDEPEFGYQIHIAKTSCGWLPNFQAHEYGISSVKDYKEAYNTGEFKILDEYGEEYNWQEFDERVLQFNGGKLGVMKPKKVEPYHGNLNIPIDDSMPEYTPISHIPGSIQSYKYRYYKEHLSSYTDPEGYEFEKREFS